MDHPDPSVTWGRVKQRLKANLGEDIYGSWFGRLELEEINADVVHLSVPTKFLRSWLLSNYQDTLLETWQSENAQVKGIYITVRVVGQPRKSNVNNEARRAKQPNMGQPSFPRQEKKQDDALAGSSLDPKLTFDTFVVGTTNALAHAAAKQVAEAAFMHTTAFNPLYIHGSVGIGKTHLLQAIAWHATQSDPNINVVYLTAEHFMYYFIAAVQRKSAIVFKEWLRSVDLLLIDDMQFLQGKSATEFEHALNSLINGARQIVIAGDRAPVDLELLEDRMRSRLSGGLVVELGAFNLELRRAIVQKRTEAVMRRFPDLHIPAFVQEHVALNIASNGRDLDGALNRLVASNQLTNEPITIEMAERTLRDLMRTRDTRRVRIEEIQRTVSKHFNVSKADLLSSRRARAVVRPRQIAMYLSKQLTPRSLPEIGRRFGGRDHTTVLHAVRKVEELMNGDEAFTREIDLLRHMLEN